MFGADDKRFDLGSNGHQELMQVTLLMNVFETTVISNE
jgi:hypothetical protein